jgi:hypothetical protein
VSSIDGRVLWDIGHNGGILENISQRCSLSCCIFRTPHCISFSRMCKTCVYVSTLLLNMKYKNILYMIHKQQLLSCNSFWTCTPQC